MQAAASSSLACAASLEAWAGRPSVIERMSGRNWREMRLPRRASTEAAAAPDIPMTTTDAAAPHRLPGRAGSRSIHCLLLANRQPSAAA